ncbi:acetolactate synthase small subunit [Silvanigrella paludirubra]|uniref:Acetolactate synthase small subunit n=1 Tax=Silvanigrella paludirubra TaxID=2499159 RepID=A0A6N6VUE4_9BACT|nr:ACT domain-containing protein [Silvanigrella paludirubra]KAB8039681.1 acetolactate synthase small subunit [Silvanigrella paludirubra]
MRSVYEISLITENTLEIFQRVAIVFSRNRVMIQKMNFQTYNKSQNSNIKIEIFSDEIKVNRILKQLQKIIELLDIQVVNPNHFQNIAHNKEVYLCQN